MARKIPAAAAVHSRQLSRGKLWVFRLVAALGLPLLLFAALELGLRLAGFGYATTFLLSDKINGKEVWVSNPRFGWRFFGAQQARAPLTFCLPKQKPPDTVRVFVFGESVAYGDPQPDFGLARLLQALLSERFPQTRFEVVNAAMTAINSHAVLPIARDCAKAGGDIWVVYMGNNEVIGPFGAGTVFGSQTPPLATIRATLALKQTRSGQLLDAAVRRFYPPPADKAEWGGMLMFLENQVPWGDARLAKMYEHFEHNLRDIVAAGQSAGVGLVVSTVAVNLKDCAPFASASLADLNQEKQARWRELLQRGIQARDTGNVSEALECFRQADQIKGGVAELEFQRGHCELALTNATKAREHFSQARDLDTLRFRCDSRLNDIIRRVAGGRESERVLLADAEAELARQSRSGVAGTASFYEHVHLTFTGNYLLAHTIATSIEKLLPEAVQRQSGANKEWASLEQCAQRLGWSDWTQQAALVEITGRLNDPPFTQQSDHAMQLARIGVELNSLPPVPALVQDGEARCRAALQFTPDDPALLLRWAGLLEAGGKLDEAAKAAQRAVELSPNNVDAWMQLGVVLVRQNRNEEAVRAFEACLARDPQNVFARNSLAQVWVRLNRKTDARREYERAIALKPGYGTAHLGLGRLLEEAGRSAEAEQHYAAARRHRVNRPADLAVLARFCLAKGWLTDAATNFVLAIKMNPSDGSLRMDAGRCAEALGRFDEARNHFAVATRLMPESGEAHFLLGRELGRAGDDAGAAEAFAAAARLLPDVVEARLNLGLALMNSGRPTEALREFEAVLARQPGNEIALQNAARLRASHRP
jgi:tetratricopeptide (TPR) repeat protein